MDKALFIIVASGLCVVASKHHYQFVYELKNWTEALSYCRDKYIDLATIDDMQDVQMLTSKVDLRIRVWIGLFRESWKWTDGSNSSFTYWKTNEPNSKTGPEPCVAANFEANANWEDWNCDSQKDHVCPVNQMDQYDDPLGKINPLGIFLGLKTTILMAIDPNGTKKKKKN
uniref:C-type lectin domain-containing protein n=1 Tax=Pundamilia nyererei TaxID=303518 RepID=A0A3B4F7L8_9CICH